MAFDFENGSYTDAAGRTVLDPAVYKDWQIGAAAEQALPPVDWFRQKLGLLPEELLPYGKTPQAGLSADHGAPEGPAGRQVY